MAPALPAHCHQESRGSDLQMRRAGRFNGGYLISHCPMGLLDSFVEAIPYRFGEDSAVNGTLNRAQDESRAVN